MEKPTTITFEAINSALASMDSRFALVNDAMESDKGVIYCSIRLRNDNGEVGTRKLFCLYYVNRSTVCIHCAKRFESVCDSVYKLNSKKTEYTLSCSLSDLYIYVKSLLAYECSLLKWTPYTESVKTTATRKSRNSKKSA